MTARVAAVWLVLLVVVGLAAPCTGYDPATGVDVAWASAGPSWAHPLGTDHLGRDVLARLAFACRAFAAPSVLAAAVLCGVGAPAGLVAGLRGGALAAWLARCFLVPAAVPEIPAVLMGVLLFGGSPWVIAATAGLVGAPVLFNDVRSRVDEARHTGLILGNRAHGVPEWRIVLVHLGWGVCRGLVARHAARAVAGFIVLEATLSWLGHWGVQEPSPSWGNMIAFDWGHPNTLAVAAPAAALFSVALATSALADAWRAVD